MAELLDLIGFRFKKSREQEREEQNKLVPVENIVDDGTLVKTSEFDYSSGFFSSGFVDFEINIKNTNELISKYRELSLQAEFERAIDDIVNEAIYTGDELYPVKIDLDDVPNLSDNLRDIIVKEFYNILDELKFSTEAYEIFKRWYVDGRIYYYKVIDKTNPKKGIVELRYVDPRKIIKIREEKLLKDNNMNNIVSKIYDEYFIYNQAGISESIGTQGMVGIKIPVDSVSYVPSGLLDKTGTVVLSYLHKAIKPFNQLRMGEDAALTYRLGRATERLIFKIDTGNLPKIKADQLVSDLQNKFRTRMSYDATNGTLRNNRRFMSVLDDYWIPVSSKNTGTEISRLEAGANVGEITDIEYLKENLYEALGVPKSRLKSETTMNFGRTSEILRDELNFAKFIARLRRKFSELFDDLVRTQLHLKNIITSEEFEKIKKFIKYDFIKDNEYEELKNIEIMTARLELLDKIDAYKDKYYSQKWIQNNILKQTDDEIDQMQEEIRISKKKPKESTENQNDINSFGGGSGFNFDSTSFGGGDAFTANTTTTEFGDETPLGNTTTANTGTTTNA